jgi:hypothetical protein
MRFLLKNDVSAESLLDKASKAAFSVVESSIPESRRNDVQMGLYVALRQALASELVCIPECGLFPECEQLKEMDPFNSSGIGNSTN